MREADVPRIGQRPEFGGLGLQDVLAREVDQGHRQRRDARHRLGENGIEVGPVRPEADDEQVLLAQVRRHPGLGLGDARGDHAVLGELRRRPDGGAPLAHRAAMELEQGRVHAGPHGGLVAVERGGEVEPVILCAALDQVVVVRRYGAGSHARDQEVRHRRVAGVRRPDEALPGNEGLDEDRAEGVVPREDLRQGFQVAAQPRRARGVDAHDIPVVATGGHGPCRR